MALIKCSECDKEFSDRAAQCPACGCPIEFARKDEMNPHASLSPEKVIEHLTYAKQLEVYKYTLETTIEKIENKINSLGHKRVFEHPRNNAKEAWDSFGRIFFTSLILLFLVSMAIAEGTFIENLIATLSVVLAFFHGNLLA